MELREVKISKRSYPVLWLGERKLEVSRYAKLVLVKPSPFCDPDNPEKQKEFELLVAPTLTVIEGKILDVEIGKTYIVDGGVETTLAELIAILKLAHITDDGARQMLRGYDVLIPSGSGYTTNALVVRRIDIDQIEWEELEQDYIIAKAYTTTFRIDVSGKTIEAIEDC